MKLGDRKKRLVFLAGNADTQLRTYLPVINELSKNSDIHISIIYTANFPTASSSAVTNQVEVSVRKLVNDFITYNPRFSVSWRFSFLEKLQKSIEYQSEVARILDDLRPDLVIIPNNKVFRNRFVYKYAALHGLKIAVIQDTLNPGGLGNKKSYTKAVRKELWVNGIFSLLFNSVLAIPVLGVTSFFKFNFGHAKVSVIAVWGANSRDIAISNGYRLSQTRVTGQPRFDEIVGRDWYEGGLAVSQMLHLNRDSKKIVFLPSKGITSEYFSTKEEQVRIYSALIEAVDELSAKFSTDIEFIIKLHRAEKLEEFYKCLPKELLRNVTVTQEDILYPLLSVCDLAITTASTAGLEALLFDTSLITINFSGLPDFYSYAASGAAIGVNKFDDVEAALVRCLFDDVEAAALQALRIEYVSAEAYLQDGCSAQRVATLIYETLA